MAQEKAKNSGNIITKTLMFTRQVRQETAKVTWPTRKETMLTSLMVVILSIIAATFFLASDSLISFVVGKILG